MPYYFNNSNGPKGAAKPKPKSHLIEDVSYSKNYLRCSCGWEGKPDEHAAHRKEAA